MPVFTAGAAAIATAIGFTAGTTGFIIAQSLIAAGLAAGTGHLLGVFDDGGGLPPIEDPGVEQRLGANTQNRVPVLYGEFMQRGALTYAEITEDRKTLYAVITLGETSGGISISKIYWDDVLLTIAGTGEVTGGVDVEGNAVTRFNGNLNIVTYPNGGRSVYLETLVDDWTSNHKMTGLAYAVVTVRYNRDEDVTNLSDIRFIGNAPINNPAEAVIDQLTNTRYGLGLPTSVIDTDSFNAAKAYYETTLPYTDASGNTQMAERFQINGSLNSADPVFERIEAILLGSNSSLRWQGGKYSIFVNKADTVEAFTMNESRVVGDIQVSEVGLNSVVNSVEVQYGRDANNNYQRNIVTVDLPTANRYPNELDRVRSIDLPLARTFVEAERIAYILLNQSREQLSIKHMATIEAMPLEAGDVITYTLPNYGWDQKQFRITRVSEMEVEDGLQYQIEAVEYAASVYTDRTHVEPGASPNTNIPQAGQLAAVTNLSVASTTPDAASPHFVLQWTVPTGLYERFDVFVNNLQAPFANSTTIFLKSVYPNTSSYVSGNTVTDTVYGLPAGSYNIWVVGRNSIASSPESNTAALTDWAPRIASDGLDGNIGLVSVRLHENIATMDPGAPTGSEGLGGDWYDPSGEYGTIPADPNPHWEARGVGEITDEGLPRIVDFNFSGRSGLQREDGLFQITRLDTTGESGRQVVITPAAPEVTEFEFAGQAAEISGGQFETWNMRFIGSSDAADPGVSEELYIYLEGNSAPASIAQELFINSVGTSATTGGGQTFNFGSLVPAVGDTPAANSYRITLTTALLFGGSAFTVFLSTEAEALDFARALSTNIPSTYSVPLENNREQFTPTTDFALNVNGTEYPFVAGSAGEVTVYEEVNFFNNPTGRYAVAASQYEPQATETQINGTVTVTVSTGAAPSEVNVQIGSIDETFVYGDGLTGAALRDNLLASIQASAAITALFTVTAANAPSGITGVTTGSPIIELTAIDDTTSYTITTVFSGDELDGSSSGVLVANQTFTQPTVQISIPTESIDETITLPASLTGSTALRNGLLTAIQANAAITSEFTVSADVAPAGLPAVLSGDMYSSNRMYFNASGETLLLTEWPANFDLFYTDSSGTGQPLSFDDDVSRLYIYHELNGVLVAFAEYSCDKASSGSGGDRLRNGVLLSSSGTPTDVGFNSVIHSGATLNTGFSTLRFATKDTGDTSVFADTNEGEPIVKLVANDAMDHSIAVTFTNGNGNLGGSQFGSLSESEPASVPTEIRITYDSDLTPAFQDIVIGGAADGDAIATIVAAQINTHGDLSATTASDSTHLPHWFGKEDDVLDLGGLEAIGIGINGNTDGVIFEPALDPSNTSFNEFVGKRVTARAGSPNPTDNRDEYWSDFIGRYITFTTVGSAQHNADSPSGLIFSSPISDSAYIATFEIGNLSYNSVNNVISFDIISVAYTNPSYTNWTTAPYFEDFTSGTPFNNFTRLAVSSDQSNPFIPATAQSLEVVVTTSDFENYDTPIISVPQRGTSNAFAHIVTETQQGEAPGGTLTQYNVSYAGATVITNTDLPSASTAAQVADIIQSAINSLSELGATVDDVTVTTTTSTNTADNTVINIIPGTNGPSPTSTNNLSVTSMVTQEGVPMDVTMGEDGSIEAFIGTTSIGTIDPVGKVPINIATELAALYEAATSYSGASDGNAVTATSSTQGAGAELAATVTVTPGVNPDGTAATLAVDRILLSDGSGSGTISGVLGSYTIMLSNGAPSVGGNIPSGSDASATISTIVNALTAVDSFTGAAFDTDTLRATGVINNSSPDITITVTPGEDFDGTAGTLSVMKEVEQAGQAPTMDFTNTVWTYYVYNQEIRVDDDTVMMEADNSLQVRRGLILNTETYDQDGGTDDIAILTDSYTTSTLASTILFTGNAVFKTTQFDSNTNYGGDRIATQFNVETSLDGSTWNFVGASFALSVGRPSNPESGRYAEAIPFAVIGSNSAGSETVHIRVTRRWTRTTTGGTVTNIAPPAEAAQGEFLVQTLLLEELVVS